MINAFSMHGWAADNQQHTRAGNQRVRRLLLSGQTASFACA